MTDEIGQVVPQHAVSPTSEGLSSAGNSTPLLALPTPETDPLVAQEDVRLQAGAATHAEQSNGVEAHSTAPQEAYADQTRGKQTDDDEGHSPIEQAKALCAYGKPRKRKTYVDVDSAMLGQPREHVEKKTRRGKRVLETKVERPQKLPRIHMHMYTCMYL